MMLPDYTLDFESWISYWQEYQPKATAIEQDGIKLTYGQLKNRSNIISEYLKPHLKKNAPIIGIYLPRGHEHILAALGIIAAGGTYMPLDIELPRERLNQLLSTADCSVIITHSSMSNQLIGTMSVKVVVEIDKLKSIEFKQLQTKNINNNPIACVLFTSGSTGVPKGVKIKKSSIVNLVKNIDEVTIACQDVILHSCDVSFDISIFDIWGTLLNGAKLSVVKTKRATDINYLSVKLQQSTISFLSTAILHQLIKIDSLIFKSLNTILVGGESLNSSLIKRFYAAYEKKGLQPPRIINCYGPSENTVLGTYYTVQPSEIEKDKIAIGNPMRGVQLYLLDETFQKVEHGKIGEIFFSGKNLAAGYLNEEGQQSFKQIEMDGAMVDVYRTGDLGYYDDKGLLHYAGRIDYQFKRQGKRISPGEIESAILKYPGVQEVLVIPQQSPALLVHAYLVINSADEFNQQNLHKFLENTLPRHMLPNTYTIMDSFPLTTRGKIDRNKLSPPVISNDIQLEVNESDIKSILSSLWRHYLGLLQIDEDENFFSLGGDSIIAIQISSKAKQLGVVFNPAYIFEYPTIAALSEKCQLLTEKKNNDFSKIPDVINLTPIQQWFFQQPLSNFNYFNQSFLFKVSIDLNVDLLRSAVQHYINTQCVLRFKWQRTKTAWKINLGQPPEITINQFIVDKNPLLSKDAQKAIQVSEASHDISHGKLVSINLFQDKNTLRAWLHITMHHIISDGISWRNMIDSVSKYYNMLSLGQKLLTNVDNDYTYWSNFIADYHLSISTATKKFWHDYPLVKREITLKELKSTSKFSGKQITSLTFNMNAKETTFLIHQGVYHTKSTINAVIIAALYLAWYEVSGEEILNFVCEGHGREAPDELPDDITISDSHGWYTTLYPLTIEWLKYEFRQHWMENIRRTNGGLSKILNRGFDYLPLLYGEFSKQKQAEFQAIPIKFNYLGQFSNDSKRIINFLPEKISWQVDRKNIATHAIDIECIVIDNVFYGEMRFTDEINPEKAKKWMRLFNNNLKQIAQELAILESYKPATKSLFINQYAKENAIQKMSALQQGLYSLCLGSNDPFLYTIEASLNITGRFSLREMEQYWHSVVEQHDFFRTVVKTNNSLGDLPAQLLLNRIVVPWSFIDISDIDNKIQPRYIRQYLNEELAHLKPANEKVLFRLLLFKLDCQSYQFTWLHHHIFIDGWTLNSILSEFIKNYPSIDNKCHYKIPLLLPQSSASHSTRQYWADYLAPIVYQHIPTFNVKNKKSNRLELDKYNHNSLSISLDNEILKSLKKLAKDQAVSTGTIFQVAWSLLLCYYLNETIVCHGTTIHIGSDSSSRGMAVNTVPVCFCWDNNKYSIDYFNDFHQHVKNLMTHGVFSLREILAQKSMVSDISLFNSLFIMEDYTLDYCANPNFKLENLKIQEYNHYSLSCLVKQHQHIELLYNQTEWSSEQIKRLGHRFIYLLKQLTIPLKLSQLQFLLPDEISAYNTINSTAANFGMPRTFLHAFKLCAQRFPYSVALRYNAQCLSYMELETLSDDFALQLLSIGIRPGDIIPLCYERSFSLVITLLGIFKAGCAYLPIDKTTPLARVAQILDNSKARYLLVNKATVRDRFKSLNIAIHMYEELICANISKITFPDIKPDTLAYVMYTSGSTGNPKGVMISHGSLMERLSWMQHQYEIKEGETMPLKTPYTFDVSVWELFWPISFGGTMLILPDEKHKDPYYLLDIISNHNISYIHFVPSMLTLLLEACSQVIKTTLKTIICIGEEVKPSLVNKFYQYFPSCTLENLYGPTEASIIVTRSVCERTPMKKVPIGFPIANVQCHIFSTHGCLYPAEMAGELCLSGAGLANGYLNQPDLTNTMFPVKRILDTDKRLYYTGDQCYWDTRYGLFYMGRNDRQIKIYGNRFELSEIESILLTNKQLRNALVIFDKLASQLIAFIELKSSCSSLTKRHITSNLITYLKKYLPDFSIPKTYIPIKKLPLLANGKVDMQALKSHMPKQSLISTAVTDCAESDKIEVQKIIEEIMGRSINKFQSLSSLGMNSLQMVELLVQLSKYLECKLYLSDLLGDMNATSLAKLASEKTRINEQWIVPLKKSGNLTPLILIHAIGGTVFGFYELCENFDVDRPLYAIQDLGLSNNIHFKNLEDMAAHYIAEIDTHFGSSEFILGGLSFGANIAVEMASQMGKRYKNPIILLDGWANYPDEVNRKKHLIPYLNSYFEKFKYLNKERGVLMPESFLSIHRERSQYLLDYKMKPIWHDLILFKAATTAEVLKSIDAFDNCWGAFAKAKLEIIITPGDHETLLVGENAKMLARHITEVLQKSQVMVMQGLFA